MERAGADTGVGAKRLGNCKVSIDFRVQELLLTLGTF